jgi:hypothetical protein
LILLNYSRAGSYFNGICSLLFPSTQQNVSSTTMHLMSPEGPRIMDGMAPFERPSLHNVS